MENWWQKPITALKGIGSKRAEAFARLEIVTIGDLLNYYPRLDSYIDYSHLAMKRKPCVRWRGCPGADVATRSLP